MIHLRRFSPVDRNRGIDFVKIITFVVENVRLLRYHSPTKVVSKELCRDSHCSLLPLCLCCGCTCGCRRRGACKPGYCSAAAPDTAPRPRASCTFQPGYGSAVASDIASRPCASSSCEPGYGSAAATDAAPRPHAFGSCKPGYSAAAASNAPPRTRALDGITASI